MIRKALAPATVILLLAAALPALAWGNGYNPCDYHPQYENCTTTTTSYPSTTSTSEVTTTTEPEVTTTQPEVTTTTSNNTTTTAEQQETTTTTAAPCEEGFIHQPPLCVPEEDDSDVEIGEPLVVTAATTPAGEETLPFTGLGMSMLAAASAMFLLAGLAVSILRQDAD